MLRNLVFICTLFFSGVGMAEGIFINSYNSLSDRYAILDEQDESAVLYLSEKGSQRPIKDAFAYMRIEPIDIDSWKDRMKAGEPPVLHKELASEQAVILTTKESDFSFTWSNDGDAVSLRYLNQPIAFISIDETFGFSKSVVKDSPVVNLWNEELFSSLFK
jgi:hypothetical protein